MPPASDLSHVTSDSQSVCLQIVVVAVHNSLIKCPVYDDHDVEVHIVPVHKHLGNIATLPLKPVPTFNFVSMRVFQFLFHQPGMSCRPSI